MAYRDSIEFPGINVSNQGSRKFFLEINILVYGMGGTLQNKMIITTMLLLLHTVPKLIIYGRPSVARCYLL